MTGEHVVRRTVSYRGRVQGVGFRYTVVHISQRYPVVGYVRNLPNGDVELVVEGGEAAVDAFLAAVADVRRENIQEFQVTDGAPSGEFDGFNFRR